MGQVAIRPTITMPANPPANVAEWTTLQPLMISATFQGDVLPPDCKMVISIKSSEKPVCGIYNPDNGPSFKFQSLVMTIKKEEILSHLGECTLKPGQYELCVEFFGIRNRLLGSSCKPFTIADNKPENFTPPSLISPAEGKVLSEVEQKQPINFRWTPIVPKPRESVTYKVTVLEVKKGQTATEARNLGNKVYENKVENQTQLAVIMEKNFISIAKDSKYAWYVEVLGVKGNLLGSSEVAAFSVASPCSPDYEMKDLKAVCGKDGKVHVTGNIIINPKSTITINQISLTSIKETDFSGAFVPTSILVFPQSLTAAGNSYAFDFAINSAFCNKDLFIGYNINFKCATTGQTIDLPCGDIVKNIPCCTCTFCDQFKDLEIKAEKLSSEGGFVNLSTSFSSPILSITSLKAELISFAHNGKEACIGCNKDPKTFGNITGGTFGTWGYGVNPLAGSITTHHTMSWFGTSGSTVNLSGTDLNISISAPPVSPLDCCDDEIQFCIRYSFTDKECRTCSFVKCYRISRKNK